MSLRVLSTLALAAAFASGAHAATVFSDDFESGAISGTSDYNLLPSGQTMPGDYGVVSDPSTAYSNGYLSSFDHTLGSANGHMQFFDGAGAPIAIWSQTAVLTAGQSYTFDYWATWSVVAPPVRFPSGGGNPLAPVTQLMIDGNAAGLAIQTDSSWATSSFTFVADHTGTYTFSIVDTNLAADANDGALDDIRLSSAVPEPASTTLLLAGLGALALAARRRRR
jgi:hypothetical protein